MQSYHGTSTAEATQIAAGNIDVTMGGGELGRGFYSGQHLHEAKAWAYNKHKERTSTVVSLEVKDDDFYSFSLELLDAALAGAHRSNIRKARTTRHHLFGKDIVWGPIVGSSRASGDQFKWESNATQLHLNHPNKTTLTLL